MLSHENYNNVCDAIRTNIWYKFKRQRITIPFPIRTLEINRKRAIKPHEEHNQTKAILEGEPLFACLTSDQLDHLIRGSRTVRFGRGEKLIEQGAEGASMFVLLHGAAAGFGFAEWQHDPGRFPAHGRLLWRNVAPHRRKADGDGAAEQDCEVIEISKPAMAAVLRDAPDVVTQLSELLATRKMETEGLLKDAGQTMAEEKKAREYRATFLRRLRSVFEL